MPCTYTGTIEGDRRLAAEESRDILERMLCAICTQMEENIGVPFTNTILTLAQERMEQGDPDLAKWWKDHKATDTKRKG